jgi:pyruvate formate lyase activating enzyme
MNTSQVLAEIERDRTFFEGSGGGATFTGGEPLAQPLFLKELLSACREAGISTVVDTCGHAPWQVLNEIRPLVDLFLYDLKLIDPLRHLQWTGVPNSLILSNLRGLAGAGSRVRVRIPLIPGINDDEPNLRLAGEFLSSLGNVPPVELLPYHHIAAGKYASLGRDYALSGLQSPGAEEVKASAAILREYGLLVEPKEKNHD